MSRSDIVDKSVDCEWVEVSTQNLNNLSINCEVRVNGVQALITKLNFNDSNQIIGFYTAKDIFSESNPKNFWGKNSHPAYRVWVKSDYMQRVNMVPQTKEFKVGKWYKCVEVSGTKYIVKDHYYICDKVDNIGDDKLFYTRNDKDERDYFYQSRFDVNSELDYDPNIKESIDKELEKRDNDHVVDTFTYLSLSTADFVVKLTNHFNQQEEVNMLNVNRVVSVKFFDDDAGLKAENSLVASYEITTRANDAMTVNKLLMREDIAGDIELHNAIRAATVDATILKNTGNKVFLMPIDFEDLRVVVSNV